LFLRKLQSVDEQDTQQVIGYGKYTIQTQINFVNIQCHINDYMFRPYFIRPLSGQKSLKEELYFA